jgi:hypothetical protein
MPLKNIILTGSIGSIPTQSYGQKMYISSTEQQSFPIERITGSSGGTFQNFNSSVGLHTGTELFINVTQSYSESIDTIAGIRTFLHDTQEEFINGEFSGSNLMVADQRLIDEDCVKFLSVNTALVNYKIYFYYSSASLYNETPIANFLNNNTSPNDGEIYLYWNKTIPAPFDLNPIILGIRYIKIANRDSQGNDNTLSLQELTSLRLKFSDVSTVSTYPIYSITPRSTYHLYSILPQINVTSSADNNVLNHAFSASAATDSSVYVASGIIYYINDFTENTDILNYFNPTTGIYTYGDTPNHTIHYTASVFITPSTTQPMAFYLRGDSGSSFSTSSFITISAGTTFTLKGTASFFETQNLQLAVGPQGGVEDNPPYSFSQVQWSFTQSLNPYSITTQTILEPYLLHNFRNTDCDVTMNNVSEQEVSGFYRRVNYNSGATIPTNQQQIISQSAEFADVKDYNYSARAHILPRYNGVRTVQKNENIYTEGEYVIDGKDTVDVGFGKTPSVQSLETYFAYFDWMGGTNPELIGKAAAHILYLIDIDGNILVPSLSSSYYYNLIDNFESGKKANIIMNAISGNPLTIGNIPIIRAGTIPMPIIASQTGSLSFPINIQSTMSFGTSGSAIPNYNSLYSNNANQPVAPNSGLPIIVLSTTTYQNNITRTGNILEVDVTSNLSKIALQLSFNIKTNAASSATTQTIFIFQENNGVTWNEIYRTSFIISSTLSSQVVISQPIIPIDGYQYRAVTTSDGTYTITLSDVQLAVTQFPQTSIREIYSGSGGGFFTSSLQSPNVLTGSYSMSLMYNPFNPLTQQNNTPQFSSSGYYPFLPFAIQPGDQIRFEGDENQVYGIISATPPTSTVSMSILLDGNVTANTNLNSFLIRRFNPNPSFITIDSDLSTYQGGGGFILPKFITNEMQENFDKNVVSLKERGLIT